MNKDSAAVNLEDIVGSVMVRHSKYMDKWCYEFGLILKSIEAVYRFTKDPRYFRYIQEKMDRFISEDGMILGYDCEEFNLDHINPGKVLLFLYRETPAEKYKSAAHQLRRQLASQPRNLQGGFWHKRIYPHQMWLDGLYMSSPFLVQFAGMFHDPEAYNDAAKQVALLYKHTSEPATGLLYHAWDESRGMKWSDDATGCSPHFWGRAMGWFVMALVDMLDYFPENHPERSVIIDTLNRTLQALLKVQDPVSGVWYQILDKGCEKGNYPEASVSCMITYVLLKGIRMGYLDTSIAQSAIKAYEGILKQFVEVNGQGLVNLNNICSVAGLGGNPYRDGSLTYYFSEPAVSNDYKGYGPFILASVEYNRRGEWPTPLL